MNSDTLQQYQFLGAQRNQQPLRLERTLSALEMGGRDGTAEHLYGNRNSPIPYSCMGGVTPPLATPTITIRTQVFNRDWVRICIKDNGSGITESVKKQLFNPFFTTKPVGKGTGLGLSISYQIVVEKHGGNLKCISEPGQGEEFLIEIPIRQSSTINPSLHKIIKY